jgi:iron complex outermembrane receptor protein
MVVIVRPTTTGEMSGDFQVLAIKSCKVFVHRSSNTRSTLITAVVGIGMLFSRCLMAQATAPAVAQSEPATAGEIAEIVVTASKRSENLSKTPLAVSVLSQDQMTQVGITSTKDLTKEVPNLSLAVDGE